jgi:hypothetical protein
MVIACKVRFSSHVYPGDVITTECWKVRNDFVQFRVRVDARKTFAINHGYILLTKMEQQSIQSQSPTSDPQGVFSVIEDSLKSMDKDKRQKLLEKVPSRSFYMRTGQCRVSV